jgi:hypothetical protein
MRRSSEPLLEAIRCELMALRHRVEAREAPRDGAPYASAVAPRRAAPADRHGADGSAVTVAAPVASEIG